MTATREILQILEGHQPVDERERDALSRLTSDIPLLADPCSEVADPSHVTASAMVVGARGVVLHRHKRLGIWLQPGGHIELGETVMEACLRETLEETGLVARHPASGPLMVHVDVHPGPRGHTHYDIRYLLVAPPLDPMPPEGESPDARWFSWEEAESLADVGLIGGLRAARRLCEFEIVPARSDDADSVAEQIADVWLQARRWALPTVANAHSDDEVREWVRAVLVPSGAVWVARNGLGVIVGMMTLGGGLASGDGGDDVDDLVDGDVDWIDQLYLAPSVVGLGLGERFVELAKELSPAGLQLWTFQCNASARRFYQRLGFLEVETTDGAANEEHEPDVRMVWKPREE